MIDAKELRIGVHVLVDGERRKVFGLGCDKVSYLPSLVSSIAPCVSEEDVEPIPLTTELLTEIGFEEDVKDVRFFKCVDLDEVFIMNIGYCGFRVETDRGANIVTVRYLHELENFIYLTLKKELIEE